MIDLKDKVAVVTGGASGIGLGICKVLAGQGADIVVADINLRGAKSAADEIASTGRKASVVEVDVTDRDSAARLVDRALNLFGKIDILVNDAGVIGAAEWWKRPTPSDDDWDLVMAVNLRGVVNVSEAVAPHMRERRYGKIVNIASIAARQGGADIPHYNASKAAVVSWTQSHAMQMAPYDVNVNAVCPGLLWTPMFEELVERSLSFGSALGSNPELQGLSGREYFEKLVELAIPMRKQQTPEDVGKLAAFLASEDAHNITGQAINVDGGRKMN